MNTTIVTAGSTKSLEKFGVHLDDGAGFQQKGDTHFCFVVPERAFEDQVVLREAIESGLVTKRLAACLLMIDPWNPIYSGLRSSLLRHVPATATIANGKSRFSADMANAILSVADKTPPGTADAEKQFAKRWRVGPPFKAEFNRILTSNHAAITEKLRTQAGFDAFLQARRDAPPNLQGQHPDRGVPSPLGANERQAGSQKDAGRRDCDRGLRWPSSYGSARPRACAIRSRMPGAPASLGSSPASWTPVCPSSTTLRERTRRRLPSRR